MVLLLVMLKGADELSWRPWEGRSAATQVLGRKDEGATVRRWVEGEMEVIL
jgi:hypothetical protein